MKKLFLTIFVYSLSMSMNAQYQFGVTLNASSTNAFFQVPAFIIENVANFGLEKVSGNKILFEPMLVFPFSMTNKADTNFGEMKGGYARAFSAPWKYLGDYEFGINCSFDHYDRPIGFYIGASYKSREVVFKQIDLNDRVHYLSPEAGIRLKYGSEKGLLIELGAFYDYVFKYKGEVHNYDKNAINNGFGLHLGLGFWDKYGYRNLSVKFPMFNFYNKDFTPDNGQTYPFNNVDRKMGYIFVSYRVESN